MAQAFIFDAIRTPRGRGKAGGGLYEVKPVDMVKNLLDAMQTRNKLDPATVEDMILATGEPVNEQGQNIAKTALVYAGWADVTTGAQLHRYCAGALDAVNTCAAKVRAVSGCRPWRLFHCRSTPAMHHPQHRMNYLPCARNQFFRCQDI